MSDDLLHRVLGEAHGGFDCRWFRALIMLGLLCITLAVLAGGVGGAIVAALGGLSVGVNVTLRDRIIDYCRS